VEIRIESNREKSVSLGHQWSVYNKKKGRDKREITRESGYATSIIFKLMNGGSYVDDHASREERTGNPGT
jgi:hypothetical protein